MLMSTSAASISRTQPVLLLSAGEEPTSQAKTRSLKQLRGPVTDHETNVF